MNNLKLLKVAILDTGVNSTSVESKVISKEFVKDSKKVNKHGDDIAKIVESQNNIVIYDAKVLNSDGLGTVKDTIAGIDWAIKNKVNVINMSYGFTHDYESLHNKIKEANSKGIIVLAANGNDIFGQKEYPASYHEVISIGVLKNKYNKSIYNSNDNADLYISLSNKSKGSVNNTSEATALATNRLIKNHNGDLHNLDKKELISVLKKE
ncbi:S8 family serine peptidase [Mammaliicoccus sp. N-M51]|uniref:S8 family serine peptidase n=1 Tax=Mammaliicoccus sp. N-M51 TaxID=2898710 RepID=UPI001EFBC1FE|nr:S8 family serine peptidase [Mammaliicoccus sp. N-M51]